MYARVYVVVMAVFVVGARWGRLHNVAKRRFGKLSDAIFE